MSAFADVDSSSDPEGCARYLRVLSGLPGIDAGKRRRDELLALRPGDKVLDAGCGLGSDVRRLAALVGQHGRAVGLDASEALLARAAAVEGPDPVEWVAGDVHGLPFGAAEFDAVRMERTLQHLADPGLVVRELLRVTRPGGVVCLCEPDWATLTVSTAPAAAAEALRAAMLGRVRNPRAGSDLAGLLRDAGAAGVDVAAETLVTRDAAMLVTLEDSGAAAPPAYAEAIRRDSDDGRLVGLVTLVTAVARA